MKTEKKTKNVGESSKAQALGNKTTEVPTKNQEIEVVAKCKQPIDYPETIVSNQPFVKKRGKKGDRISILSPLCQFTIG